MNIRGRKCIGDIEKGISDVDRDFGTDKKRDVVGMLISHVGDFLIHGTDSFISYISDRLGNEYGVEVSDENEAIYSGMRVKASNEVIDNGDIFYGSALLRGRR